jgi:hypothetical protein
MENKGLYSDLIVKLNRLVAINKIEPEYKFGSNDPNSLDNIMKRQEKLIDELKTLAKQHNTILGRTIKFPMADSYALYVITKVNKNTVQVTWLKYCDAWVDDRLGYRGSLSFDYASRDVKGQDALEEMFSRKRQNA